MKLFLLMGILILMSTLTPRAQVTIGANQLPNPSAVLDLQSNDKLGLLLPRVSLTDTLSVNSANPVANVKGMFVYNTNTDPATGVVEGIYYNDGQRWRMLDNGESGEPWQVSGTTNAARLNTQNIYQMGQVTIGADTLVASAVLNVVSKNKGLLIPELTEEQRDSIASPADGLIIYNIEEGCYDYYNAQRSDWESLCGGAGAAKFSIECDLVEVNGTYVAGTPLSSANYLTVPINVTTPGSFTLVGSTANGYSFAYSSTVTAKGQYFINMPALGTPETAQDDNVMITGSVDTCYTTVPVQSNIATYDILCSSIVVNGTYIKGTPLDGTNSITMNVTVGSSGYYYISTPLTNGVQFTSQGNWLSSQVGTSQRVTLLPSQLPSPQINTPTVNQNFPITINSNSPTGNVTCSATIPVILPDMQYALIGTDGTYSAAASVRTAAFNGTSFGRNGTVKILSLTQAWGTDDPTTAANYLNTPSTSPTKQSPDIVLFYAYGTDSSPALVQALSNYVNKGGVLIYASTSNGNGNVNAGDNGNGLTITRQLLDQIYGSSWGTNNTQWQGDGTDDQDYAINSVSSDPIINGPFGNLSVGAKYWGEDNATNGTIMITSLPSSTSVQICSAQTNWTNGGHPGNNPLWSVVWYDNLKNLFFFGDTVGANSNATDYGGYPACYTSAGVPVAKPYGFGNNGGETSSSPYVFNATLELNVIAWGLQKAAVAGINPH